MDTLRGNFGPDDLDQARFEDALDDGLRDWNIEDDGADEESTSEPPPAAIGTDERRMQVRAYNHWASMLGDHNFPSIEDLDPANLPDFGPYSVLLDFTLGVENPGIQYLGDQLAIECGTHEEIDVLSDIPSRSLLSRITDHYMQILANQAPIGFEAEFVNQRGATILYRGILLPFSSDGEAIDFIYGVINWKEMADQMTTDELMLEIDQALEASSEEDYDDAAAAQMEELRQPDPVTDWADGPASDPVAASAGPDAERRPDEHGSRANGGQATPELEPGSVYELGLGESFEAGTGSILGEDPEDDLPSPLFGTRNAGGMSVPRKVPIDLSAGNTFALDDQEEYFPEPTPADGTEGLYVCLAAARELAFAARSCEDRSRSALYAAVGRAYDFSLAAQDDQAEFNELVSSSGLAVQDRAPMTPVVKLVFGGDYDKTRLTEYAAVLSHAHRLEVGRGMLASYLAQAEGGLKGVVKAERRLRREENGQAGKDAPSPQEKLARKLRSLPLQSFETLSPEGEEFALVMIRRMPDGTIAMLGEITGDGPLVERAARKLAN